MAGVELAFMAPHAWIIVAGKREAGQHDQTKSAFRQAADEVAHMEPDLLVVASPHWNPAPRLRIGGAPRYTGTLDEFLPHVNEDLPPEHRRDLPPTPYDFPGTPDLAARLREAGESMGLPVQLEEKPEALDHGSMVPILCLNPDGKIPVLLLSIEEGLKQRSREWGEIIGKEIARAGLSAVFVASGTLSHHFVFDQPDALWPEGEKWDKHFLERLKRGETEVIFGLTDEEIALGGLEEGGLHGLYMLLGAIGTFPVASTILMLIFQPLSVLLSLLGIEVPLSCRSGCPKA